MKMFNTLTALAMATASLSGHAHDFMHAPYPTKGPEFHKKREKIKGYQKTKKRK